MPSCLRIVYILIISLAFYACKKDIKSKAVIDKTIETQPAQLIPVTEFINENIGGFYVGLPRLYSQNEKKYPVLFFIHGGGQFGNGSIDLPKLLNEGPIQLLEEGIFPPNFKLGDKNFSFIVVAPQFRDYAKVDHLQSFIDSIKSKYRIDESRMYLSGLSMGSVLACDEASTNPIEFAAVVPMAGVSRPGTIDKEKIRALAGSNLPFWVFHNSDDFIYNIAEPTQFVSLINSYLPTVQARLTVWPVKSHDAWTKASDPKYKEDGKNIYEWMLQYHR